MEAEDKAQNKVDTNTITTSTPVEPVLQDDRNTVKNVSTSLYLVVNFLII